MEEENWGASQPIGRRELRCKATLRKKMENKERSWSFDNRGSGGLSSRPIVAQNWFSGQSLHLGLTTDDSILESKLHMWIPIYISINRRHYT